MVPSGYGARRRKSWREHIAYIVGCVDGRERALKPAYLLGANVGLAEFSSKQVIVAVFNCSCAVVLRGKLIRIVAKKCAFA